MGKKRSRTKHSAKKPRRDIYQEVTDSILRLLDQGTVPWHNPIRGGTGNGFPKNLLSKKPYRGINVFLLSMRAWECSYGSDYWLTFRQAASAGGQVRKGEKSSLVTFWKLFESKDKQTGDEIVLPVLRHYNVFNAEQCEGIEAPDAPLEVADHSFVPLEQAESISKGYRKGPQITHTGSRACYRPSSDTILIAEPGRFIDRENYYGTLFHEYSHSTGHSNRLDRGLDREAPTPFGTPDYSKEELIAEMGAAFLNASAGISPETIEQSAAYIDNWRKVLKDDKRLVVVAAGAAQKSADWILGKDFKKVSDFTPEDKTQSSMPRSTEDSSVQKSKLDLF